MKRDVKLALGDLELPGILDLPESTPNRVVVFAHGSGSSRLSSRNAFVAASLGKLGLGTLLFDLLTSSEDESTANRFDIELLTGRLVAGTKWLKDRLNADGIGAVRIGYFGASTGAAASLCAAVIIPDVKAVVSRGGRPDLASDYLSRVKAPTLLIVGGRDLEVLSLNRQALDLIQAPKKLEVVPGATHLFEETGTLAEAARLSGDWFLRHL